MRGGFFHFGEQKCEFSENFVKNAYYIFDKNMLKYKQEYGITIKGREMRCFIPMTMFFTDLEESAKL